MDQPSTCKKAISVTKTGQGHLPWPVGTVCKRDKLRCISYEHDGRCFGRSCPMKDQ